MFELTKIPTIINHLNNISTKVINKSNEIIIFCPYCNDAKRSQNPKHGHLYLSKNSPVFHCFRCDTSGTLTKLLIDTGFQDEETIQYISQFVKYKFVKDYYSLKKKSHKSDLQEILNIVVKYNYEFKNTYIQQFEVFKNYIQTRIGTVNYIDFLITPAFLFDYLCCQFYNSSKELITSRFINHPRYRYYVNSNSNRLYYFQNRDFDIYKSIVIAEGPFDIINLYLYNKEFQNNFFIAMCGKNYISCIEKLLIQDLLLGEYNINVIFDADIKSTQQILFKIKKLVSIYNEKITINGYIPLLKKDVADYPLVQLLS